jgi:hypothetical protein
MLQVARDCAATAQAARHCGAPARISHGFRAGTRREWAAAQDATAATSYLANASSKNACISA